jgi:tRNA-2-methylthio-N6-dimethylallyladenosine synthase
VPKEVVQQRYERLLDTQNQISWDENKRLIASTVNLLVANDEGRKDGATERLSGRAEDGRLAHFSVPPGSEAPRPGDVVSVRVSEAKPFFLLADPRDPGDYSLRRTRSGDAWDRWQAESCGVPAVSATPGAINLGMPTIAPVHAAGVSASDR